MADTIWQTVLGEIEVTISRASFGTWFKNTKLLENKDGKIVIGVPNIFIKQHLQKKFEEQIKDTLTKSGVKVTDIEYRIHSSAKSVDQLSESFGAISNKSKTKNATKSKPVARPTSDTKKSNADGLNIKYRFDNFVVGSANELAYAAAQSIARDPGNKYNPFFVYGGVGLGKTHLIQAIGNELVNNSGAHVTYITSESFISEFVTSIRKKNSFTNKYRETDVLIVDDMQFIAGKDRTQEEFFHTFNTLHQANKQIIISSDKPPSLIPTLEERLKSRFEWGMIADIGTPDFETRCAILQAKAENHSPGVDGDVIEYLASTFKSNIRELEGSLVKLLAFCELRECKPTIEVAKELLGSTRSKPKHLSPKHIVDKTAKYFHIEIDELTGPKRDREIVLPRQIAMYLMRSELHLSFPKIAKNVGRKDHTTAIHSVDKIEREQILNEDIKQHIIDIKEKLYA